MATDRWISSHAPWPLLGVTLGLLAWTGCTTVGLFGAQKPLNPDGLYGVERQLTFAGRRSGEGYFDPSGETIVFQSERIPDNPFYQIYRMNLESGQTNQISSGHGKSTCGWIDSEGAILFASTHLDPAAESKQKTALEERATGKRRRYAWNFDPQFDLFIAPAKAAPGQELERLTNARGYDAEASISPDGRLVVFSSNRHAFEEALAPALRERPRR